MGKSKKISLKSAVEMVKLIRKNMVYYKDSKKACYLSYINISKKYPAYDKNFFYQKLKPYILSEKETKNLIKEDWIKESKEYKKKLKELLKIEKHRFFVICAGDHSVYENTFGYPYQFLTN